MKFSFSQLSTYDRCPYQYKLQYIDKVSQPISPGIVLGLVVHKTLERYHQQQLEAQKPTQATLFAQLEPVEIQSLHRVLARTWESYVTMLDESEKDEIYSKAISIITTYINGNNHEMVPRSIEQSFTCALGKDFTLRGRIDRIDKTDTGLHIIDYKSKRLPEDQSVVDPWQLYLYAAALHEMGTEPVEAVSFMYLQSGDVVTYRPTEQDMKDAIERARTIAQAIKDEDFEAKPELSICNSCSFSRSCTYAALS